MNTEQSTMDKSPEQLRMEEKVKQATFRRNSVADEGNPLFHGSDKANKIKVLRKALEEKSFVIGKEERRAIVDGNSAVADWAHFDFMMSSDFGKTIKAYPIHRMSSLEMLMVFWAHLWPYLNKMFQAHDEISLFATRMVKDNEETLIDSAEIIEDNKIMQKWIAAQGEDHLAQFNEWQDKYREKLQNKQ